MGTPTYPSGTLLKRRRTRIVATVGPASEQPDVLEALIRAGVNVFRLNLSHGHHAQHRAAYDRIRAAAAKLGEPIAVLADLCGPKIRVGRFQGGKVELTAGQRVTVTRCAGSSAIRPPAKRPTRIFGPHRSARTATASPTAAAAARTRSKLVRCSP